MASPIEMANNHAMLGALEACIEHGVRCVEVWHSDALKMIVEVEIHGFVDRCVSLHKTIDTEEARRVGKETVSAFISERFGTG